MPPPPEQPTVRLLPASPPRPGRRAFSDVLFGRRLASSEDEEHRIGPIAGVSVLGLDALASAAYGPEAALTLLLPLGALAVGPMVPITSIIVALLLIVYFSYRQTISAYSNGGGSYTVARENLHPRVALLAGAALAVDYVLNVAVGISAGVGALASAFPILLPHLLACCLGILALLTLVNLRGTRDTGLAFLVPTASGAITKVSHWLSPRTRRST
jgi:amino acid transporter